jgi:hypothetical protein
MLTGSMASNFWGVPRSTHGLDFVLQLPRSSIPMLLSSFGDSFVLQQTAVESAYDPPHQFNAIDQRSALKVDFWMLRENAFEQAMFARRLPVQLFGVAAWIATAEDVILHKLFWHGLNPSERQLGDAAGIVAVQEGKLDQEYLRQWAAQLGFQQLLEDLLAGRVQPKSS